MHRVCILYTVNNIYYIQKNNNRFYIQRKSCKNNRQSKNSAYLVYYLCGNASLSFLKSLMISLILFSSITDVTEYTS